MSDKMIDTDFTPPTIEEISDLLPAYEIISFIAKGGMGAVYMAKQRSLDRPVAIKILPRHFGEDAEFRASFEAEAKSMAKLNHPNLIGIYDFGQVDGLLYIIMEMVQGKSLYHSAYGKKIAPTEAARIVREICLGLAHAHKHGILHRDIKPANILLDPSASPKIGDFGLARPVGEHEKDSAFGTPGYTAPEVVNNPQAVDESTDIYAVGVLLYELLTSKLPEKIYTPVSNDGEINPKFDQIIRKAIHPTPAMRYRDAEALAEALLPLTEKNASNNPLLTRSATNSPAQPQKSLITPGSTPAHSPSPSSHTPSPVSPPTDIPVGSNIPLIRNIIIIIALLAAISIAWEGKKRSDIKREQQAEKNKQLQEQKEANRLARKKRRQELAQHQKTPPSHPKPPKKPFKLPPPKKESPRESLARLQSRLKQGIYDEMPHGAITRDSRTRFFIKDKMTWFQAQAFCEKYGGYLAVLPNKADLQWVTSTLSPDSIIWLGGGTSSSGGWTWIDGTNWTLPIRNTSNSKYASVDYTGILTPRPPSEKHSFYIEWTNTSSHPASLKNQLIRCAKSLQSDTPQFPAGSIKYDNRNYLIVQKKCDWQTTQKLAKLGGGNLAVPSNPDENQWIVEFISEHLTSKEEACWIGGLKLSSQPSWQWVTGEPWEFAKWTQGAPKNHQNTDYGCAVIPSQRWKDYEASERLSYFLIEWSNDNKGHKAVQHNTISSNVVAEKQAICLKFLTKIKKKYEKLFANNIESYERDIRVFHRGLPKSKQEAYLAGVTDMQSRYVNGRIPDDIPHENMPPQLEKILNDYTKRQAKYEEKYLQEVEKLQQKYRKSLSISAKKYQQKGLKSQLRRIQAELKATKTPVKEFIEYISKQND